MNKKIISVFLATMIVGATTLSSPEIKVFASEQNINILENNYINIDEIKKILTEQGIDEETQKNLIEKKLNGELWDAENPEKIEQVPADFYILDFNIPFERKVYTFDDGSILELSHSPKLNAPRKVISNAYTTVWIEEKVTANYGAMRASIYVDCEWSRGVGPKIRPFTDNNIYVWNVGGTVSTTNMAVTGNTTGIGKISVYNSSYFGKHSDFRAKVDILGSHGTVSFQLTKM